VAVVAREQAPPEALADDAQVTPGSWVLLSDHLAAVAAEARHSGLRTGYAELLEEAGALHDVGKAHPVFQATLHAVDGAPAGTLLAKSPRPGGAHARPYFRHELASALALHLAGRDPLVVYLVGAHHGRVRLSIRPGPDERAGEPGRRRALGVEDGDELPAVETPAGTLAATTLDLDALELGGKGSWAELALALRDDPALGPFRLGALEALLRIADWRVSARG